MYNMYVLPMYVGRVSWPTDLKELCCNKVCTIPDQTTGN